MSWVRRVCVLVLALGMIYGGFLGWWFINIAMWTTWPGAAALAQTGCVPNPNNNGPPFVDGCPLSAVGLNKIVSGAGLTLATSYGADPTGTVDSTLAINNCLAAVGKSGTCFSQLGRYKVLGNLTPGQNQTLSCGFIFNDSPTPADLNTLPAILLDHGHSIIPGGPGFAIKGCLILANGMTFPTTNSSGFSGIAVQALYANNASDFDMEDTIIVGFDTCVYVTTGRPYFRHWMCDGSGVTKAAMELDTGNTDSGYVKDGKVQRISQANYSGACSAAGFMNPGTGLRIGPNPAVPGDTGTGIFLDTTVVQEYMTQDFDFSVIAIVGTIWADDPYPPTFPTCTGIGPNIVVESANFGRLEAQTVYVNGGSQGLVLKSDIYSDIGALYVCCTRGSAIVLGDGTNSGQLEVRHLEIGGFGYTAAAPGIKFTTTSDVLVAFNLLETAAQNSSKYIDSTVSFPPGTVLGSRYARAWVTSFFDVTNPFGPNISLGAGSDDIITSSGLAPTITGCTGVGSTGGCALGGGTNDLLHGSVVMTVAGSGPGASGQISFSSPQAFNQGRFCTVTLPSNMGAAATAFYGIVSTTTDAINWATNGAALGAGAYGVTYSCAPR